MLVSVNVKASPFFIKLHFTLSNSTEHFEVVGEFVVDAVVVNIISILDLSKGALSRTKELSGVILNVVFF